MKNRTALFLLTLCAALSVSAMRYTNTVTGTVDTRDYMLSISSPYGESFPSTGTVTQSWRSSVSCFIAENPLFHENGNVLRQCSGFFGDGIAPQSGAGDSAVVMLTNINSSLTWEWDTSYWVTWDVTGLGEVQPINMAYSGSGAWCKDGVTNHLRAIPGYGWLLTGWSGDATGGPSTSNLYFVATVPMSMLASFSDDPDGDGLKNVDEWAVGGNPWEADTDGDGFDDLFEFNNGLSLTRDSSGFVTHIQDNPETYGLYTSNALVDVAVGQVALNIEGATARLRLQVEQSDDLVTWTNAGDVVEWTMPVTGEKRFMRVRSGR